MNVELTKRQAELLADAGMQRYQRLMGAANNCDAEALALRKERKEAPATETQRVAEVHRATALELLGAIDVMASAKEKEVARG